jgi:hypothetical protein
VESGVIHLRLSFNVFVVEDSILLNSSQSAVKAINSFSVMKFVFFNNRSQYRVSAVSFKAMYTLATKLFLLIAIGWLQYLFQT